LAAARGHNEAKKRLGLVRFLYTYTEGPPAAPPLR
jgi:hypothetical protein